MQAARINGIDLLLKACWSGKTQAGSAFLSYVQRSGLLAREAAG